MATFKYPPPLAEITFDNFLDPESLILQGLGMLAPTGDINPLYPSSPYNFTALKYPDDIEHFFMHGHYMNFFINVPVWSKYYDPKGQMPIIDLGGFFGSTAPSVYGTADADYFGNELPHAGGIGGDLNYVRTQRITQAISIYVPDSVSFSSGIEYENTSAYEKGTSIINKLGSAVEGIFGRIPGSKFVNAVGNFFSAAGDAASLAGFTMNENVLVLFRKMNLRSFQYDFFFAPKSEKEALAVRNIIRAFRFHAHPEVKGGYGIMYVAPGTFDIEFMHRGKQNQNVQRVSTCVLTNVDVDYAPYGWTTHVDGMPIQTRLSLSFTETEVMTKEKIEQGY